MQVLTKYGSLIFVCLAVATVVSGCAVHPYDDNYANAKRQGVCPDVAPTRLFNAAASPSSSSGSGWTATSCEQVIIKSAIDYCTNQVAKTDFWDNTVERVDSASQSLVTLSGAAVGIAGLAVGSAPTALAGGATLLTTLSTNIGKIFSGSPPSEPTSTSMMSAAQSYAQLNQYLIPPDDPADGTNPFYAGLWNATGASCPTTLLAGGFRMASVDNTKANSQYYNSISIVYKPTDNESASSIAAGIVQEILKSKGLKLAGITVSPCTAAYICIAPAPKMTSLTVAPPTISVAPGKAMPGENVTSGPAPVPPPALPFPPAPPAPLAAPAAPLTLGLNVSPAGVVTITATPVAPAVAAPAASPASPPTYLNVTGLGQSGDVITIRATW